MSRPEAPGRSEFRHWHRLTLRWADNDAYGHVNNAVYYQWFDSAVNDWLVKRGLLDIVGGELIALVVETGCTYFSPLAYPGEVEVGLRAEAVGRSSICYALGIFAPGVEQAAAAGRFVHVAVDRTNRRPVAWPQNWAEAFASIA